MNLIDITFYFFAIVVVLSAAIVVFSRNIIYSAFALLFTFFGVAGFYVLLSADFLAVTQLLIYVGGILVLMLFGVMLTNKMVKVDIKTGTLQVLPATLIVAMIAGTLIGIFTVTDWKTGNMLHDINATTTIIGNKFMTTWVLPFEIASVVLLVALLGAAIVARPEKFGARHDKVVTWREKPVDGSDEEESEKI
ncbi:MAG: NADH-quinone oxidoreductase subunit J [Bacteroidetes bacterium]|nr:NADH-quinone oxidoreductase subunit J [Bacteroidota bacterium]